MFTYACEHQLDDVLTSSLHFKLTDAALRLSRDVLKITLNALGKEQKKKKEGGNYTYAIR